MTAKAPSVLLLFLFLASLVAGQTPVRLAGSDLLGGALEPILEAAAEPRGWELSFAFKGSLEATAALEAGDADVIFLALPQDNPPTEGVRSWPLAFEVTIVVVNENNPIQELSLADLRTLFADSGGNEEVKWGAVAAESSWSTRPVNLHAVRQRDHLNLELFRALVLGPRDMRVNVRYWDSAATMLDQIAEDSTALGLVPLEEHHPQLRPLFLSLDAETQAYNATPQSVFYGDYPLRLGFYVVVRDNASPAVAEVLRFLFSDDVAAGLEAAGYMPVPETERRQFQLDLDFGS